MDDVRLVVEVVAASLLIIAVTATTIVLAMRLRYGKDREQELLVSSDVMTRMQAHIERQQILLEREQSRGTRAEARIDSLELEIEDLRESWVDSAVEVQELRAGLSLLVAQIEAAKMAPVWTPEQVVKRTRTRRVDVTNRLVESFTVEEINDLAFEFGLSPDNLEGETRSARARSLTVWAADHRRLGELSRRIDELRPRYSRPNL